MTTKEEAKDLAILSGDSYKTQIKGIDNGRLIKRSVSWQISDE